MYSFSFLWLSSHPSAVPPSCHYPLLWSSPISPPSPPHVYPPPYTLSFLHFLHYPYHYHHHPHLLMFFLLSPNYLYIIFIILIIITTTNISPLTSSWSSSSFSTLSPLRRPASTSRRCSCWPGPPYHTFGHEALYFHIFLLCQKISRLEFPMNFEDSNTSSWSSLLVGLPWKIVR